MVIWNRYDSGVQQRDTWGWKPQNLCALGTEESAMYGECQMAHRDGTQGVQGYKGGGGLEKASWNPTIKGLECSEEFGLIIRIYRLCTPTSHVLVS